jgi:hypothetical protein
VWTAAIGSDTGPSQCQARLLARFMPLFNILTLRQAFIDSLSARLRRAAFHHETTPTQPAPKAHRILAARSILA